MQTVFKGKTYSQLQALHLNIETKIRAGGSNLDIGYWESLLQQVRVYMARARYERGNLYCASISCIVLIYMPDLYACSKNESTVKPGQIDRDLSG